MPLHPDIFRAAQALLAHELTLPHAIILMACERDSPTMTDLSRLLRCSTAAVTGQIDRLVERQLVERTYDPKDRRIIRVRLTVNGQNKLHFINATFDKI